MDVHLRCWEKVISYIHNSSFRWSYFFVVILCISRVGISRFMFEGNSFVSGTSERSIFDKVQVDEDINKGIEAYKSISNNSRD